MIIFYNKLEKKNFCRVKKFFDRSKILCWESFINIIEMNETCNIIEIYECEAKLLCKRHLKIL